jgi:hypothetical protein
MRLMVNGEYAGDVLIYLSRAEAGELRSAADALLRDFDEPGYHAHVSSTDDQIELALAPDRR